MKIKDIKIYTIEMHWTDAPNVTETKTVAIGMPDFLEEDRPYEDWTEAEEEFDNRIFHYYDDYEEFINRNQIQKQSRSCQGCVQSTKKDLHPSRYGSQL